MASPSVFFCNDEGDYAVGCVDRRLSSQKRRRVHEAIHTSGPHCLLFCLIRSGCQSEVLHHLDSPYIYDCRATAMLVAEAGPLVAMIYRRRPWRGPAVARESKIARHMLFMLWPSHHPSGRHRRGRPGSQNDVFIHVHNMLVLVRRRRQLQQLLPR